MLQLREAASQAGTDRLSRRAQLAEARARDADSEIDRLRTDGERYRKANVDLNNEIDDLESRLTVSQRSNDEATHEIQRLRRDLDRVTEELQAERQRSTQISADAQRVHADRSAQGSELNKALREANELRETVRAQEREIQVSSCAAHINRIVQGCFEPTYYFLPTTVLPMTLVFSRVQSYRSAVEELKSLLDEAYEERNALASALEGLNHRVSELTADVGAAKAETAQCSQRAEEASQRAASLEAQATNELQAAAHRIAELEQYAGSLHEQLQAALAESKVTSLESALRAARQHATELAQSRDEIAVLLDESNDQLRACIAELRRVQAESAAEVDAAVRAERGKALDAERSVTDLQSRLREANDRGDALQRERDSLNASLKDATDRLAEYEAGYGIAHAAAEIRQLQAALASRDADISRMTTNAGAQWDRYDSLLEITHRMALQLGHPPDTDVFSIFPMDDVRASVASTWERLRAANSELGRQNEALEEQRVKLLHQLRVQAAQTGEEGLRHYGLTAEQMAAVNEFAENLRNGLMELPLTDRSMELQRLLQAANEKAASLEAHLRVAETELAEASEERTKSGDQARRLSQSSVVGDVTAPSSMLRTDLQQMSSDNQSLRAELRHMSQALATQAEAHSRALASARGIGATPVAPPGGPWHALTLQNDEQLAEVYELLHQADAERRAIHPYAAPMLQDAIQRLLDNVQQLAAAASAEKLRADSAVSAAASKSAAPDTTPGIASLQHEVAQLRAQLNEMREVRDRSAVTSPPPQPSTPELRSSSTMTSVPPSPSAADAAARAGAAAAAERELAQALRRQKEAESALEETAADLSSVRQELQDLRMLLGEYEAASALNQGGTDGGSGASSGSLSVRVSELHSALRGCQALVRRQRQQLAQLCREFSIPLERLQGLDVAQPAGPEPEAAADAAAAVSAYAARVARLRAQLKDVKTAARADHLRYLASKRGLTVRTRQLSGLLQALAAQGMDTAPLLPDETVIDEQLGSDDDADERESEGDVSEDEDLPPASDAATAAAASSLAIRKLKQAYQEEVSRLQQSAQSTLRSLRDLLSQKSRELSSSQEQLVAQQRQHEAALASAAAEREKLLAEAEERSQQELQRLREALLSGSGLSSSEQSVVSSGALAELQRQLHAAEDALAARNRRVSELESAIDGLKAALSTSQQRATDSGTTVEELKLQAVMMQGRMDEADRAVAQQRADSEAQEAAYKAEITARDRKLAALTSALESLRSEFIKAEEEHAHALGELASEAERLQRLQQAQEASPPRPARRPSLSPSKPGPPPSDLLETERLQLASEVVRLTDALKQQKEACQHAMATSSRLRLEISSLRKQLQAAREAGSGAGTGETAAQPSLARRGDGSGDAAGASSSAAGAAAQLTASLEAQRGLRRRVDLLQSRLDSLTSELEASRSRETSAASTVERLRADRVALERRLASQHNRQEELEAATKTALAQLLPAEITAAQMAGLQDQLARAKSDAATLNEQVVSLQAQLSEQRKKAEASSGIATTVLAQLQQQASATFEPAAHPAVLLEQLRTAQLQLAEAAPARDLVEPQMRSLKAQLDAANTLAEQQRGRLLQLTALCTVLTRGDARPLSEKALLEAINTKLKPQTAPAAAAASRATAGTGAPETPEAERDRAVRALRATKAELAFAREQLAGYEAAPAGAGGLRLALKKAHAEIAQLTAKLAAAEQQLQLHGSTSAEDRGATQSERRLSLSQPRQPNVLVADSDRPQSASRRSAADDDRVQLIEEINRLQQQCRSLEERLRQQQPSENHAAGLRVDTGSRPSTTAPLQPSAVASPLTSAVSADSSRLQSPAAAGVFPPPVAAFPSMAYRLEHDALLREEASVLRVEVQRLAAENDRLRDELSAFDVDFFDQLEDLKFKYLRAARKCRAFDAYVELYPPADGLPEDFGSMLQRG